MVTPAQDGERALRQETLDQKLYRKASRLERACEVAAYRESIRRKAPQIRPEDRKKLKEMHIDDLAHALDIDYRSAKILQAMV